MAFCSMRVPNDHFLATLQSAQMRLFSNQHPAPKGQDLVPRLYFMSIPVITSLYALLLQPQWVLGGEMYAEMATNYFRYAQSPDLVIKIFSLDAGYIPLPQRLISAFINLVGFRAAAVPYIYTWISILFPAFLVGAFCLPIFRPLVPSDAARFIVSLIALAVADFETRTFVNFTYFGIFFCMIVVALALMPDADDAPWWAWGLPILLLSKPYMLIVLPITAIAAFVAKPRMRAVLVVGCLTGAAQIAQLAVSAMRGEAPGVRMESLTLFDKLWGAVGNFFGLLGGYTVFGKLVLVPFYAIHTVASPIVSICTGLAVAVLLAIIFFARRDGVSALILVGLSVLFFNCLLNAFATSALWNTNFSRIPELPTQKHIIGGYFGFVLIIAALGRVLADLASRLLAREPSAIRRAMLPCLLIAWFGLSGWATWGIAMTAEPAFPSTGHSQWQSAAAAVDNNVSPLCVPIDPIGWLYARDCRDLAPMQWQSSTGFGNPVLDAHGLRVAAPEPAGSGRIVSLGIPLKAAAPAGNRVRVRAVLETADGREVELTGERIVPVGGGVVLLQGNAGDGIPNVRGVRIVADVPMMTLTVKDGDPPVVMWLGH